VCQLCDVVLVLPGPRRIPAHRIVLSSASDYFSAMFTSDVLEATQNEVNMKDVDPDAMTALVKYMYDGEYEYEYNSLKFFQYLVATGWMSKKVNTLHLVKTCCSNLQRFSLGIWPNVEQIWISKN